MPDKNLPIQFFAHREGIDDRRTEAGGSSEEPRWLLPESLLKKKADQLISELDSFRTTIVAREKKQSIIPFVFKAHMRDNATAKSKRNYVAKILDTHKTRSNIIGLLDEEELIIRISTVQELRIIIDRIKEYNYYKYGLSCLDRITIFNPFVSITDKPENYKVRLINFQDYGDNLAIARLFENILQKNNYSYRKTQYAEFFPIYNIQGRDSAILDTFTGSEVFEALFSLEPMPKYSLSLDTDSFKDTLPIMNPKSGEEYATLGILDSGIERVPHLAPWIENNRWTTYPNDKISPAHGTFIAAIALYGDNLEKASWIGHKGIKLFDAAVFPDTSKESIEEDELVENIREVIKINHEKVKVWNLSISMRDQISESAFSDFAISLDDIQETYNVLICKSVGNCDNFKTGHPIGKLHKGADSVLSLVIGSIAHEKGLFDFAEVDNPSPFSRIGPGPEFIVKPELVHYGGNAGVKPDGTVTKTGVKTLSMDGGIAQVIGTSFSTPRIAGLAVGLYQEINQEFDPLLIKGMVVHSAQYPDNLTIPNIERTKYVGFGKPSAIPDILYNDPHEITLILRETLVKGNFLDILDFPMPSCLIKNGFYTGQLIATLVYSPILEPSQGSEYCQSNIDVLLGTYDNIKERDTKIPNILNPIGRDNPKNIFKYELYSKKKIKTGIGTFSQRERLLIEYADKYYPVKKYAVDLSEMTDTNKEKYVTADKKWNLKISGLYRSFSEQKATHSGDLSQDFCLLITIKDPTRTLNIYNETIQRLDLYNFLHSSINLHSQVKIRN
jgi:hypothetical protein